METQAIGIHLGVHFGGIPWIYRCFPAFLLGRRRVEGMGGHGEGADVVYHLVKKLWISD